MVINIRIITDENTAFDNDMNKAVGYVLESLAKNMEISDVILAGRVILLYDSYGDSCGFMTVER